MLAPLTRQRSGSRAAGSGERAAGFGAAVAANPFLRTSPFSLNPLEVES
jgi:hypothetical protein